MRCVLSCVSFDIAEGGFKPPGEVASEDGNLRLAKKRRWLGAVIFEVPPPIARNYGLGLFCLCRKMPQLNIVSILADRPKTARCLKSFGDLAWALVHFMSI